MRIERMRATFGKLKGQELRLQPGLNVITGANEAGKTTWLAFMMAMLYGVDTRSRPKAGVLPDKLKYSPWSGEHMEGTMEIKTPDRTITIERTSRSSPMGDFRAWDSRTGDPVKELTGRTCGQTLLGVEEPVYARSGCLRQQRAPVSADPQLEKRLSGLVTAGREDYAYFEIDEKLKRLQSSIRHNQAGELPRAEEELARVEAQLRELADHQQQLAELQTQLHSLKNDRRQTQDILNGLDALEVREQRQRLQEAKRALDAAVEDREGWQTVCQELPTPEQVEELQRDLRQLQEDLQRMALEDGLDVDEVELPEADPIFGRMGAREAHDKAASDAMLVQDAARARRPRMRYSPAWITMVLLGFAIWLVGFLAPIRILNYLGLSVLFLGLALTIWFVLDTRRRQRAYLALQQRAKAVLDLYQAQTARDVVLRGAAYLRSLGNEAEAENERRQRMIQLADRKQGIFNRVEALMPGSGTPDKAAALFMEVARAHQALEKAKDLEAQRREQLEILQLALGDLPQSRQNPEQYQGYNRQLEAQHLDKLDERIREVASQADQLAGAISRMGDPLALTAQKDELTLRVRRLQERLSALHLARQCLENADETLRSRFSPLLCQRTGELFSRLTGGKYDKIQLDRSLRITARPANGAAFRQLSYLSGGTVDQLYLALRLAICDLLLPDAPIILDDALVYFDDKRTALALETLREMSKTHQILLFTCQSREKRILDRLAEERKTAPSPEAAAAEDGTENHPEADGAKGNAGTHPETPAKVRESAGAREPAGAAPDAAPNTLGAAGEADDPGQKGFGTPEGRSIPQIAAQPGIETGAEQ